MYNKFLIALIGGAVATLSYLYADATWLPPLMSFLTALGVYQVPNKKELL